MYQQVHNNSRYHTWYQVCMYVLCCTVQERREKFSAQQGFESLSQSSLAMNRCKFLITLFMLSSTLLRSTTAIGINRRTAVAMTAAKGTTSQQKQCHKSLFKEKTIVFARHGQATHNPRAEAQKEQGCSHETFMKLMQEDDQFDADLTPLGVKQAEVGRKNHGHLLNGVDLVVSSPLSRAIKTADLIMSPESNPKRICIESLREINGLMQNAKRRSKSELKERFHECWDFDSLTEEDKAWTHELEEYDDCSERGYQSLLWLLQRDEEKILVVSHGGILRFTMVNHPLVHLVDERDDTCIRFSNCEMRQYTMSFTFETNNDGERPLVILTEQ